MTSSTLRCLAASLALGLAVASVPAAADHDRRGSRGKGRIGPAIGLGFVGPHLPGWIGFDGLALSVGDRHDDFDNGNRATPRGFRVRAGSDLSRRLGVEVHAGYGRDTTNDTFDSVDTWVLGAFVRVGIPLGRAVQLNGLMGFGSAGVTQRIDDTELSDESSGLAFGVSMDVRLAPRTSLSGGWTRYASGEDAFAAVSGWSLGIKVGFY